ncbi:hypothetical protein OG426_16155 [Streptomyces canus]|uniref:hypothetical protein n=1 Tax=Streptomyces canus TaxID=58343 RepID=UPI00386D4CE8|nr:hypothetical protein OG426_16155 [Streptomyces canus]
MSGEISNLPEQYRRYARTALDQDQQPVSGPVELYDEREPVVWVPGAYGGMVPVRKSQAPAPLQLQPPRDLSPQPLLDQTAQRLLGGGIGSGVALWGGGQFLAGAGQFVSGLSGAGALLFFLALAGGRALLMGGGARVHNEQHTHVHQKWFGRTNVTNQQ